MTRKSHEWRIGDLVGWWQSSEWDEEVPRFARGVIAKSPCGDGRLWVRDEDTNDFHELNVFNLTRRV